MVEVVVSASNFSFTYFSKSIIPAPCKSTLTNFHVLTMSSDCLLVSGAGGDAVLVVLWSPLVVPLVRNSVSAILDDEECLL